MEFFIKLFHVLISLVLIFVVLLQSGKGAEMGAAFGGSSKTLLGAAGSNTFMTKLTTFCATLFIITCLTLAYMSSHMATSSLMSDVQSEAPIVSTMPVDTTSGNVDTQPVAPFKAAEDHAGHSDVPAVPSSVE